MPTTSGHFRTLFGALALAALAYAYLGSQFWTASSFPRGSIIVPVAFAVACLVVAAAVGTSLVSSALWFGVALVGQAVALQMIDAGTSLHFQHYRPIWRLVGELSPTLLLSLVFQTVAVGVGLRGCWPEFRAGLMRRVGRWRLLGLGLVFGLSSAAVSQDIRFYVAELVFAAFVQAVNLANIVLILAAFPRERLAWARRRLERLSGWQTARDGTGRVDGFALVAALWVFAIAATLSVLVYERHPHLHDEVAYLYQARLLAAGTLTAPSPPVPAAFETYLIQQDADRSYPVFPPGWPAMLAIGVLLGVPWLVNPTLAGVNVLLTSHLLGQLYDRATTRLALILLSLSPWHLFMAMNFMSHTFHLTCALVATVAVIRAVRTTRWTWNALAGAALGMATLIRPLDGIVLVAILGVWFVVDGWRRLKPTQVLAVTLGIVAVASLTLLYNHALTGDAARFPLVTYFDRNFGLNSNAYGFGPDRGLGWAIDPFPGHGPIDGLVNANLNTFSINIELLGWSTGSLLPLTIFLLRGRLRRADVLMLTVVVAVFIAYFFYYFSGGPDFGARYWFLMLVPGLALTARGLRELQHTLASPAVGGVDRGVLIPLAAIALCASALINYIPWRAVDKYHQYLGMRPDIRRLAQQHEFAGGLVLVAGRRFPDYASAMAYNSPALRDGAPVYAWDRSPAVRAALMAAFPHRPLWVVHGPSVTGDGFKVVAGPLPPARPLSGGNER